jgi:hypothetical protein
MLSCNEVTRLYASDALGRAPLRQRLAVRLHLMMCDQCSRYVKELRLIAAAARRHFEQMMPEPKRLATLERSIKDQIRQPPE